MPVSASAGQCQSLDALDGTVLIVDDNGTAQGNFRCETTNGITGNITLDCGDGQTYSSYGSVFEHACIYTHAEIAHTHAIQCLVENMSSPACKEDIITDEATL